MPKETKKKEKHELKTKQKRGSKERNNIKNSKRA
jgi:hypothetical protein